MDHTMSVVGHNDDTLHLYCTCGYSEELESYTPTVDNILYRWHQHIKATRAREATVYGGINISGR